MTTEVAILSLIFVVAVAVAVVLIAASDWGDF
jgi:hypothetical protein